MKRNLLFFYGHVQKEKYMNEICSLTLQIRENFNTLLYFFLFLHLIAPNYSSAFRRTWYLQLVSRNILYRHLKLS